MKMRYYQLQELLDKANERLALLPKLDQSEFTKRTIYYYLEVGLLPRRSGHRRGPQTRYPVEFVDRLIFIRRLQNEEALTLDHIRQVLDETPPETIHRVATGEERLKLARIGEASPLKDEQTILMNAMQVSQVEEPSTVSKEKIITSHMISSTSGYANDETAQVFPAGHRASLVVNGPLNKQQRRQLKQACEMIKMLLGDEED